MFKILNGYENIDSNIFFKITESKITRGHNKIKESKITRGHNYMLVKKQSRLDVRKYSIRTFYRNKQEDAVCMEQLEEDVRHSMR